MSERGSGSKKLRGRVVLWCALAVAAVTAVGGVAIGLGSAAGAEKKAAALKSACQAEGSDANRAIAADALRALDSSDGQKALDDLAAEKDDRVATAALIAIGRSDHAGARTTLRDTFEDTDRPDLVRSAAFSAWARLAAKDGTDWDTIAAYGKDQTKDGSTLRDSVLAVEHALFPKQK